jgi:peptide-methionine (R)-S-oxide reductase
MLLSALSVFLLFTGKAASFQVHNQKYRFPSDLYAVSPNKLKQENSRRCLLSAAAVTFASLPSAANAINAKSRSEGYAIQRSEREWAYILSGKQYNILREGGTEQPYSSILESEERDGEYKCAGCGTPLFLSSSKFHSGTGWPSFATALKGVETESVNPIQANLLGAEIRCATCGGHLGDVFNDGKIFLNTPAFSSGKRYCVDGAALIFEPSDGKGEVYGDQSPPIKVPSILQPPKITPVS